MIPNLSTFARALVTATFGAILCLPVALPAMAQTCEPGSTLGSGPSLDTGAYSADVAAGDFNEDGIPDLAVANYEAHTVTVHLGLGGGAFAARRTLSPGSNPRNVVLADFTQDGIADIAVSCLGSNTIVIFPGLGASGVGNGDFGTAVGSVTIASPRGFAAADFNEDGILDLAGASIANIVILLGQGTAGVWNGGFAPLASYAQVDPWDVVVGDWNKDGVLDLAVANISNGVWTQMGTGNGEFETARLQTFGVTATDIVVQDFDADGRLDLATSGSQTALLLNHSPEGGEAQFVPEFLSVTTTQSGIAAGDFNADNLIDLAITNPSTKQVWLRRAAAPGLFVTPLEPFTLAPGPIGIVASDLNQDGVSDVAVTCSESGTVQLLLSNCGPAPAPVIVSAQPVVGQVGDPVTIQGMWLLSPTAVKFNGVAAKFTSVSPTQIQATVPAGTSRGPISVTTTHGATTSNFDFWVTVQGARLALLGVAPNPLLTSEVMRVRFMVPQDGRVTFRMLDIAGRLVLSEDLGPRTVGEHEALVSWKQRPAAGIYLAWLEQDGRAVSTKLGVIR